MMQQDSISAKIQAEREHRKDIRERILKLLSEKADEDFTSEDKELLRQYEGAGSLHEINNLFCEVSFAHAFTPRIQMERR